MADPERVRQVHERMGNPASYDNASTATAGSSTATGQVSQDVMAERVEGQLPDFFMQSSQVGNTFLRDIFQEEKLTPHKEFERVREMRQQNAFVETAVATVRDLIMGKHQRVVSEDEDTQEFFNEQWDARQSMIEAMRNSIDDFVAYFNGYAEIIGPRTDPDGFKAFTRPERMWIVNDDDGRTRGYVQEVPKRFIGANSDLDWIKVGYGRSNKLNQQSIRGVMFEEDEVIHMKGSPGPIEDYGRSRLASAISDHKILKEIERSMAIFARFKSVPKKAIGITDSDGQPLSQKEFDKLVRDWNRTGDFENFLTNGRQFDINDMDYADAQARFEPMVNYLKRKITSVLGPEFYFHGETTTHAVSHSQQATFFLQVQGWRDQILKPWNRVLQEVAEARGLASDVHWEFGPFDFETDSMKREKALKAWNGGLITNNEARQLAGLDPAADENIGDAYKWEVDDRPATPLQQLQQHLDKIGGGNDAGAPQD